MQRTALETVQAFIDAATSADRNAALAFAANDIVINEPPGLPYGGRYRGHDGLETLHARMAATWEGLRGSGDRRRFTPCGDNEVLVEGAVSGTVRSTGAFAEVRVMERYEVRNGRVVQIDAFYFDSTLGAHSARPSRSAGPMQDSGKYGAFAMSPDELRQFLTSAEQTMLATLRRNGAPFVVPCGFGFDEQAFYVTLGRDRDAVKRLRHDPRVSLTVASSPPYPTKFVVVEGLAEEVDDPEHEISRMILLRGPEDKWEKRKVDPERFFESWVSVGRVVFRIAVTSLTSFDGTKTPREQKYSLGTRMPTDPAPKPSPSG